VKIEKKKERKKEIRFIGKILLGILFTSAPVTSE
jgi:hypothetical protein